MKCIINLFFAIIYLTSINIKQAKSQNIPTVFMDTIYTENLHYGDTIIMPVKATDLKDIGSIGVWITYDTKVLFFNSLIDIISPLNNLSYNVTDNIIKIGWYYLGSTGLNFTNISLFKLKFIYKGGSGKVSFYLPKCHISSYTTHKFINIKYYDGILISKPFLFNLLKPQYNSYSDSTPDFQWNSSFLSVYYKLFIDGKLFKDSIYLTSYQINTTESLSAGYHNWFVIACNESDTTKSYSTGKFFVDKTPPKIFALNFPMKKSAISSCNLKFNWHSSVDSASGLSGYRFFLSGFPSINLFPQDTFISNISYIPIGNYTWFVKAIDKVGNETISQIDSFAVKEEKIDSVSGYVTYDNSFNYVINNVKLILKTIENLIIDSTITNSRGYYVFRNLANGNYIIEANTDNPPGGINPTDALLVNRKYIKLYSFTDPLKQLAADVNGDDKINPNDALLINRYYIKAISSFKAGKWRFEQANFSINCDNPKVNFKGISTGDVNGSYAPQQ